MENPPTPQPLTISPEVRQNVRFFSAGPCWFPGCEELRTQYREEVARAEARKDCSNCARGAINRKYLTLVANAQASSNQTT